MSTSRSNSIRHRTRAAAAADADTSPIDRIHLEILYRNPKALKANARNARKHPKKQLEKLAAGIRKFGFNNPVMVDSEGVLLAGHGRVAAAIMADIAEIPTICLDPPRF